MEQPADRAGKRGGNEIEIRALIRIAYYGFPFFIAEN